MEPVQWGVRLGIVLVVVELLPVVWGQRRQGTTPAGRRSGEAA